MIFKALPNPALAPDRRQWYHEGRRASAIVGRRSE